MDVYGLNQRTAPATLPKGFFQPTGAWSQSDQTCRGGGGGVVWLRPYTALSPFKALGWVEGHLTPHRRLNTSGRRETKSMEHFIRGTNYKAKYLGAKPGPSSTAAKQSASLPQELARFPRDRKPLPPVPSHTGISHHSGFP